MSSMRRVCGGQLDKPVPDQLILKGFLAFFVSVSTTNWLMWSTVEAASTSIQLECRQYNVLSSVRFCRGIREA